MHGLLNLGSNSLLSLKVGEFVLSEPLGTLEVRLNEDTLCLCDLLSNWLVGSSCFLGLGILSDGSVAFLVKSLKSGNLGLCECGFPSVELFLESVLAFLLEDVHVGLDVSTEDVISVLLGIISATLLAFYFNGSFATLASDDFLLLNVIAWESLGVVGNVKSTICSTLKGTEDSVTGGGSDKTDIEESLEWASLLVISLGDVEEFAVNSLETLVDIVHT